MDRIYADEHYRALAASDSDSDEGYMAVELYAVQKGEKRSHRTARVIYWDVVGQFYFETFSGGHQQEAPLKIID